MNKILFIVHEYYPNPSAITNCLSPIIQKMIEEKKQVFILTRKNQFDLKNKEKINSVSITRINDDYELILKKRDNNKGIIAYFYRFYFHILWLIRKKTIYDGSYSIKKMIKEGKKLLKKEKIDIIISCSYPFSSHIIANKIKKDIPWIAYQFDPYSYNYTLLKEKVNKRLNLELNCLEKANKIFITKENYIENMKTELKILKDKYVVLPYPLIKKPNLKISSNNQRIVLVFAGTLYEHLREPFLMLDILLRLNIDYEIHLYYGAENPIIDKLEEYKNKFGSKLVLKHKRPKEECDLAISKANIVLNVGNIMLNQTPSKVFELISFGKPIINFYNNREDTSKNILKEYELCYNIDVNNFREYNQLESFCLENKNKILPFEVATKNYIKQEEAVDFIIKEVEKVYENR